MSARVRMQNNFVKLLLIHALSLYTQKHDYENEIQLGNLVYSLQLLYRKQQTVHFTFA